MTLRRNRAGKSSIYCPECKEKSAGKLKYVAESNSSHAYYYCPLCKEHWDPTEVLEEEYKTAVFRGYDGEYKFVKMTKAKKEDLKANSNMWKESLKRKRDDRGKFAGGMNKKDINMLKRLRRK